MRAIRFKAPTTIEAAAASDGKRRFQIKPAYGGGPLLLAGWQLPVVVDLAGMTVDQRIVANLDHDSNKRVGHVEAAENDGKTLSLSGTVSASSAASSEFVESAGGGFPWQASIEAEPGKIDELPRGKTATVNGREFTGPMLIARTPHLYGVAFVSHGADRGTSVLVAKGKTMSDFQSWASEMGIDTSDMTPAQLAGIHANYHGRSVPTAADHAAAGTHIHASSDPVEAEQRRLRQIDRATSGDFGEHAPRVAELRAKAITGEMSVDALIEGMRPIRSDIFEDTIPMGHTVRGTRDRSGVNSRVIEAAALQALGAPDLDKHFGDQVMQAAHDQFRGRIGLQQMIIVAASANGMQLRPGDRLHTGNLREALAYALPAPGPRIHAAGGFSTLSLPNILSNVANKELLLGYQDEDATWREIAQVKSVSDFKDHTSYRLLDNLEYEQVAPDGEIKHGTLGEETFTRSVDTFARMFQLTRKDIINDDLGAFDALRTRIGRGAAQKFNNVFWTAFLADHATFFTAARTNYFEGATSNLGTDYVGLQLGLNAFRDMRSPSADGAKRIGGRPAILLVPPELETNAHRLLDSQRVLVGTLSDTMIGDGNPFAGRARVVVQDRLSDSSYTGYSTTAWYIFRAPAQGAVMVASFLNGMQTPTVESAEADFNVLGVAFRGYHDFGADQAEYLAGVKSKGAA